MVNTCRKWHKLLEPGFFPPSLSRPHSPFRFSLIAGGALAQEMKGSGDKGFPILDSRTSGLHVCSREVSIYYMGESWRFLLPLKISLFCFKQPIKKKFELIQKSHVPRARE